MDIKQLMEYLEPLVKIKFQISQIIYLSDIIIQIIKIKNISIISIMIIIVIKYMEKIIRIIIITMILAQ